MKFKNDFPLLIPDKNGLYFKMKLTTSKFKRIKRSYAGGLLIKKELSYFLSCFFFFFPNFPNNNVGRVMKKKTL